MTTNGTAQRSGVRTPPYSLEAEQALLGAMLLSRDAIDAGLEICTAECFYKPAHGHIFEAVRILADAGQPADPTTVADELRRMQLLDDIGGPAVLITLMANTPATTNAARYATIVKDMARLRHAIAVAAEIADLCYSLPEDVTAALERAEALLAEVVDSRTVVASVAYHEAVDAWLGQLERVYDVGEVGIATGIIDLDDLLHGLRRGEVTVIGARPSQGKSLLGSQIAFHAARTAHPTLLVGIEMPTDQTVGRLIASEGKVDFGRIRTGKLSESDWPKISYAISASADLPLWFVDDAAASVASIRSECRRLQKRVGLEMVVVDYLQIMQAAKAGNRQEEVALLSGGLRRMARELDLSVVALAQLSRNLEFRSDKRPTLADLRESGSLEQDAHVVIGIYREEIYEPDTPDRGIAELSVLKNRNGLTGVVKTAFVHMGFRNMARM